MACAAQGHVEQPFDMALDLSTTDYLFLAIVPGSAGFVVLLVLDLVIDSHVVQMIGARLAGLSIGLVKALAGMLIVFPLMIWASLGLELFYRKVGFQHPNAHQLLTVMKETHDPLLRGSLVFGACFVAPLFEEFLFRGHIQTVFVRFLLPSKRITPDATSTSEGRTAKRVWVAIFLTSVLFAVVHPAWTIPLILLLSLCLGYAYERTGNLWVSVFLHALFNTSSTVYFLWFT